jgi:hypothetical protein
MPELGDRRDQAASAIAATDPQIVLPKLELVQVHLHAVTLPGLAGDLHLVLRGQRRILAKSPVRTAT